MSRIEHLVGGGSIEVVVLLKAREKLATVSIMTTSVLTYLATHAYILNSLPLL